MVEGRRRGGYRISSAWRKVGDSTLCLSVFFFFGFLSTIAFLYANGVGIWGRDWNLITWV